MKENVSKEVPAEPKKEVWMVGEIATQTQPVIVNTVTEEQLDLHLALARILNALEQLKKLL